MPDLASLEQGSSANAVASDRLTVIVARREIVGTGVAHFELRSAEGQTLPPFEAGAHVDVHIRPDLVRQYSLCGDPADTSRYRLAVRLEAQSRGGSTAMHADLGDGDRLQIGYPRNQFPLAREASRAVLIAGGIGITPLMAMGHALDRAGVPFHLHYCVRSRDGAAFRDELAAPPFAGRVSLHADDDAASHFDASILPPAQAGTHLYVCGPGPFMDARIAEAKVAGWADDHLHLERFSNEVNRTGDVFTVTAVRSGVTVTVAAHESIAEALIRDGVDVALSCEQGVCGTCLVDVIEGVPDHRDCYLTDAEKAANRQMTICCSRAKTASLALDV
ncbi:MAG: PDR/VanB family oxidoreductase [Pseudolabrys sp.]